MTTFAKITGKKYALNNSYFKNSKADDPDTFLDIVQYWHQHQELPFEYSGNNWIYDTMIERQKRYGVKLSQYITPDETAKQIGIISDSFIPKKLKVLNACCGIGQISAELIRRGLKVTGFDIDQSLVEACTLLYPEAEFYTDDFLETTQTEKWELIISNPPHEQKLLIPFLEWLSNSLTASGHAIVILPKDYFLKPRPAKLVEYSHRFFVDYHDVVRVPFAYSNIPCEILVLRLSDNYKSIVNNNSTPITYNIINNTPMKANNSDQITWVKTSDITISPNNPRKTIKQEEIIELAQSINTVGLLQPITLRPKDNKYEIIAGEKRYRAFLYNAIDKIPAFIRNISDEEAFEMALAENLNRSDLSPIEEAKAFQHLLDTGKYKPEDIASRFGKTHAYIRSRLKLLNLTDEFSNMLQNEEIFIGMALELSNYSKPIQTEVYKEHFTATDSSSWKNLGIKDLSGRMIRLYTMDLDHYSFDKTQCSTCPYNTDTNTLFDQLKGKCTNIECLKKKRDAYTLDICKKTVVKPDTHICVTAFDKLDSTITEKLQQEGITIINAPKVECPQPPKQPKRSDYNMEFKYNEAMEQYKIDNLSYYADMDGYEQLVEQGEYVRCIYIGDNDPKPAYVPVQLAGNTDKVKDLENEDKSNKDNAIKNIFKDSLQILKSSILPTDSLSVFEEELLLFLMLEFVDARYFTQLGIANSGKSQLTDTEKSTIFKNINDQQKNLIKRAFILRRLSVSNLSDLSSRKIFYLPELGRQHFPEQINKIVSSHMVKYSSKNQKIQDKIREIQKNTEVVAEAEPVNELCETIV